MPQPDDAQSHDLLLFLLVVLVVSILGLAFDWMLVKEGVKRLDVLALSNGLTGLAVGLLYLQLTRVERERRGLVQQRLRTIAEMNHHIRNALQIIAYANVTSDKEKSVELIRSSVERIEWALREVLPGHVTQEARVSPPEHAEQSTPAS
ncbi:MAG: hypothetical protein WAM71_17870 [Candidatus Korobacteraceae bacterium]